MRCKNFKCVKLDPGGECLEISGECIGDLCEEFSECLSCQKITEPGDCWKDGPDQVQNGSEAK